MTTAGSELNLFVKHHYRGMVLSLGGGLLVGTGSILYANSVTYLSGPGYSGVVKKVNDTKNVGGIIGMSLGGALSLVGLFYVLEAPIHVKRASLIMNENGVGISVGIN
jgi:hypothetical protein